MLGCLIIFIWLRILQITNKIAWKIWDEGFEKMKHEYLINSSDIKRRAESMVLFESDVFLNQPSDWD
jgi:hypothetical protein